MKLFIFFAALLFAMQLPAQSFELNVDTAIASFNTAKIYFGKPVEHRTNVGYQPKPAKNSPPTTSIVTQYVPASKALQSLYIELGGPGVIISANYDARFTSSNKGWGFRTGLGMLADPYSIGLSMPAGINYLAGAKAHHIEMGAGASFICFESKNQDGWFNSTTNIYPWASVYYRYQPVEKRFMFRAGINQLIGADFASFLRYPYPGLSFGYRLK